MTTAGTRLRLGRREMVTLLEPRVLLSDFTINDMEVTVSSGGNYGLFQVDYDGRTLFDADPSWVVSNYSSAATKGLIYPEQMRVKTSSGDSYFIWRHDNFKQSTTTATTWNSTTKTLTQTFEAYFDPAHPVYFLPAPNPPDNAFLVFGNPSFKIGTVTVATTFEADPTVTGGARMSIDVTTTVESGSPVSITGVSIAVDGLDFGTNQGEPDLYPSNFPAPPNNWVMADTPERPGILGTNLTVDEVDTGFLAVADDETRTTHSTASDAPFGGEMPRFLVMRQDGDTNASTNTITLGNYLDNNYVVRTRFGKEITPGNSDTMQFSVRLAPAGNTVQTVGADVFSKYATYYAGQVVSNDRRPMLESFIANPGYRDFSNPQANPNGFWISYTGFTSPTPQYPWLARPSGLTDTQWEDGKTNWLKAFANTMMSSASTAVSRIQSVGGQGDVIWDFEGMQYTGVTYYGAPNIAFNIAPEWGWVDPNTTTNPNGYTVAKRFFKTYTDAGFKPGLTIRPQTLTPNLVNDIVDPSNPWSAAQVSSEVLNTIVSELTTKISYAKTNWDVSLFYVDSTSPMMDAYVFKRVMDAVPGVLIMPENQNVGDYAYTAAYDQLPSGPIGTSQTARDLYPNAFSVLSVIDHLAGPNGLTNDPESPVYQAVLDAVEHGDVIMAYNKDPQWDPTNQHAATRAIYSAAYGQASFPDVITTGQPYTITLGPGPNGRALMGSTWTIDWGDGSTPYTITYNTSNFPSGAVTATHTYAAASEVRHITATFNTNATGASNVVSEFDLPVYMTASAGADFEFTGSSPRTLELNSGTFTFTADASGVEDLLLEVHAGASAVVNATQHFDGITLDAASGPLPAATLTIADDTLFTDSLSVASGATLDVGAGNLVLNYSGSSPIAAIRSLISIGYNGGAWTGTGITSNVARDDSADATAVGYGDAAGLGITSFGGETLAGDAVIVTHTYYGDSDLSGAVEHDPDFFRIIDGINGDGAEWFEADFDYNNDVDMVDFDLLVRGFKGQGGNMTTLQADIAATSILTRAEKASYLNRINLDTTFGTGGRVSTNASGSRDWANAVAALSGAKVLAVGQGTGSGGTWDFNLVRYNADGTLDTGFDTDGKLLTHINGHDVAMGVAIQSDGKAVVVGGSNILSSGDFALVRYNTDGSLDTGFDSDGVVTTDIGGSSNDLAYAVAIDGSGNIVVAGGNSSDFVVARYSSSGALDTSFDSDGIATVDFGGSADEARALAIDGSGNIVVLGNSGANNIAIARLTGSGALDTSFSSDGKDSTMLQGTSRGYGVGIQSTGKIVIAGHTYNSISNDFYDVGLARYNTNGTLDTSFGTAGTGKVQTNLHSDGNSVTAMYLMSNDKILVAGNNANQTWDGSEADMSVVRYNANGTLDTSLGGTGSLEFDFTGTRDSAQAITVDSNGCIVLAGLTMPSSSEDFALIRLLASP